MITKEQKDKATQTLKEYQEQLNNEFIKSYTCICCREEKIDPSYPENIDVFKQEQAIWGNGTVEKISFGYGSVHDMKSFYIAICDNCIKDLEQQNIVQNIKNLTSKVREYNLNLK